ncbi:hypothetical protein NFI96_001300 [Prochilodus magdalenae]|nr:hypothetical protein NFI96_001300 [Prochilodus magdalenae]
MGWDYHRTPLGTSTTPCRDVGIGTGPILGPGLEAFGPFEIMPDMTGKGRTYVLDNRIMTKLLVAERKEDVGSRTGVYIENSHIPRLLSISETAPVLKLTTTQRSLCIKAASAAQQGLNMVPARQRPTQCMTDLKHSHWAPLSRCVAHLLYKNISLCLIYFSPVFVFLLLDLYCEHSSDSSYRQSQVRWAKPEALNSSHCMQRDEQPVSTYTTVYDRKTLLHYRNRPNNTINDELRETLRGFGLLRQPDPQTAASPEAGSRKRGHRKRCARPQKRGKRAGVRTRLTSKPARAALPSILLSNVCSLENKLDCIRLQRTTRRESRDCCVFVFTETWLSDSVPDAAIQLDGLASFRADRDSALCDHHHTSQPEAVDDCRGACSAEGFVTSAFKEGDKAALRKARAKLSRGIREAKRAHGQSIHSHFRDSGDTRRMWQGIQAITNYRTTPPACDSDASLPDALNHFYARFEAQNGVAARKTTPPPDDQVLCLTAADVRKTLRRVNPRESAGPDNIPARVLSGMCRPADRCLH